MQEVYDFLKKCGCFYLATVEEEQPRVRPFGTVVIFEGKIYIQTEKSRNVSKQMTANPKVEIYAYIEGKWVRVAATVVEDDRVEACQHMLNEYPALMKMRSVDDGKFQVFYLKDAEATFNSITEGQKSIKF